MMLEPIRRRSPTTSSAVRCSRSCVIKVRSTLRVLASSASWETLSRASGRVRASGHSSSASFSRWGGGAVFLVGELHPPLAGASTRCLLPRLLVQVLSTELSLPARAGQVVDAAGGVSMIGAGVLRNFSCLFAREFSCLGDSSGYPVEDLRGFMSLRWEHC
jgi:hypothetical protein